MADDPVEMPTPEEMLRHCASDSAAGAILGVGSADAEQGYQALFTTIHLVLTLLERTKNGRPFAAMVDVLAKQLLESGPDPDAREHFRDSWHHRAADEDEITVPDAFSGPMINGSARAAVTGLRMALGPLPAPLYAIALATIVASTAETLTERGSDGHRTMPTVAKLLQSAAATRKPRTLN
jgi:hypothetical protein